MPTGQLDDGLVLSRVSSQAVHDATGRSWSAWLAQLDADGVDGLSHPELVAHLEKVHGGTTTGWWRQAIAVGYAQARGRRAVGQTRDAGFQVGVQRTVDADLPGVWELLTTRPDVWLGAGAQVAFVPGSAYEAAGAVGQVRVVRPEQRLRMTWQPRGWPKPATLQLTVSSPRPGRTAVHVHLEKLPDAEAREQMRAHWRAVLEQVADAAR